MQYNRQSCKIFFNLSKYEAVESRNKVSIKMCWKQLFFFKIGALKNFGNFTGKKCVGVSF